MNLSDKLYNKLEEASNKWAEWQKKVIILDEGRKATFSACVIKHKKLVKTMSEAEKELTKARYHYNNIDRYVSLKQSELKRDLTLNNKV